MKPLIGITCSRILGGAWSAFSLPSFMDFAYDEYSRGILEAGGAAVLIPVAHDDDCLAAVVERMDGVLLSGGVDIHPRFYGEQPRYGLGDLDEALDRMELGICRRAMAKGLPILAICRGIQLLNVALGGSLYQDISRQVPGAINHQQNADKGTTTHLVEVEPNTPAAKIFGASSFWVNGKHHQAIKRLAGDLEVAARAPDGVIECVYHPRRPFVIGVQWHPEGTRSWDEYAQELFRAFVAAAGGR